MDVGEDAARRRREARTSHTQRYHYYQVEQAVSCPPSPSRTAGAPGTDRMQPRTELSCGRPSMRAGGRRALPAAPQHGPLLPATRIVDVTVALSMQRDKRMQGETASSRLGTCAEILTNPRKQHHHRQSFLEQQELLHRRKQRRPCLLVRVGKTAPWRSGRWAVTEKYAFQQPPRWGCSP